MNNSLKNIILENEKVLLDNFPNYKQSINQFIIKIKSTKYDKMLYDVIVKSFVSKEKYIQEYEYNKKGFKSARQLINEYIDYLDMDDNISLSSLVEGNKYSSLEICSLANNYNNQVGMYYIKNLNSVIIKSTVDDNNRTYDDRWIKKGSVLKYYMQTEKDINVENLVFSYKPNAAIFNALMEGKLIDIYTFINSKKGQDYEFKGIYHPCGLIDGNRAFLLFKHGFDNEIPYDNLDTQFLMNLIKTGNCPEVNCGLVMKDSSLKIGTDSSKGIIVSKRNFIQQKKIDLEVSIRGEEIILKYEQNKLRKYGLEDLANKVENVSYYNSDLGYDIHSYDINENGKIVDIYIKVQSLVSNNKPLLLTKKEYSNLINDTEKYKLYKVYNIYTDQPRLYIMNNIKNKVFEPNTLLESNI